jgi:hypothetical protein
MNRFIFVSVMAVVLLSGMTQVTRAGMGGTGPGSRSETLIVNPDPNLVGWWKFDDGGGTRALDSSAHGNQGMLQGGPQWVQGYVGGALSFDGIDDGVDCGSDASLMQVSSVSVAAWIKLGALGGDRKIVSNENGRTGGYKLGVYTNNKIEFEIRAVGNIPVLNRDVPGGTTLQRDTWYHVVGVYDKGDYLRTYVNGKLDRDIETSAVAGISTGPLLIGRESYSVINLWLGLLDDVRVYNRVLAEDEIGRIMQGDFQMAWGPWPEPGTTLEVREATTLTWSVGDSAIQHDVYLGTDANAVKAADLTSALYWGRQLDTSFSLAGKLDLGGRYFWRIDEVEADGTTIHKGTVWAFTVLPYLVVDEFESYTDGEGNPLSGTWIDGSINGSGSLVGRLVAAVGPYAGRGIVHGGSRAMSLSYDNTRSPFYSEAQREFAPAQDWTVGQVDTLSLWFKGDVVSFVETAPGAFTMSAVGDDIWSNFDQFRYAHRQLAGDGAIVARVDSVGNSNVWAKAGVMIRASLDPGSTFAFMFVTPDGRRAFQDRPVNKSGVCLTAHSRSGTISLPFWVKVERKGNQFTGYFSTDGVTWVKQPVDEEMTTYQTPNPQTIPMPDNVYIGLALTSHAGNVATTATFSHVQTTGAVRGQWEAATVGLDQPGNSPDGLYVIVEDNGGQAALAIHPDPAATNAQAWTEWRILLSRFTGVNLKQIKKVYIGVGGYETKAPDDTGRISIDDIRVWKP